MSKHGKIWPTLVVGFIAGAAAGMAGAGKNGERSRRIKRQAADAMRTVGEFAKDLTDTSR